MNTLFLAWQDPNSRAWVPIGRLTRENGTYRFVYTQGARTAGQTRGFQPLLSFPSLTETYESDSLFPLFQNRVPSTSRSDYDQQVEWLNIPKGGGDPIVILSRSGGRRATDQLEVLPSPEPTPGGGYLIHFFAHGISHLPDASVRQIAELKSEQRLLLVWDLQNSHHADALMLRTEDGCLVGWCPRYIVPDLLQVLNNCFPLPAEVRVERVNPPPAPLQVRLLCTMSACWPPNFLPFAGSDFQPIVNS